MKTIVVAIDFSKYANFALRYAVNIANAITANILIVWVDKTTSMRSDFMNPKSDYLIEAKSKLETYCKKYSKKLINGKIDYKIRKGKVYQEVVNQAKYSDASLIVAGSYGNSGFEEAFIGGNVYKIVASAICPVITIKNNFCNVETLDKILLPIDSTYETRQKVPFTATLAKAFNAEVIVLSLYPSSTDSVKNIVDDYSQQVISYFIKENVKHSLQISEADGNIADIVINEAKANKVNLISIMTEQETTLQSLWLGTYAHQIVNRASTPVICFNTMDIFDISTR